MSEVHHEGVLIDGLVHEIVMRGHADGVDRAAPACDILHPGVLPTWLKTTEPITCLRCLLLPWRGRITRMPP